MTIQQLEAFVAVCETNNFAVSGWKLMGSVCSGTFLSFQYDTFQIYLLL